MGIFNRKSAKIQTNGEIRNSSFNSSTLKSPPPTQASHKNSAVISPSALDVTLPAPPDPALDPAAYLKSIWAVRARCQLIYQRAKRNQLAHFDVDSSKFGETATYLVSIIKVEYNLQPFRPLLTDPSTERLRSRLFPDTFSRPMATLRSRWTTSSRATHSNVAPNGRRPREDPPSDRPLPRFRLARRRCWNRMVIQIKGVGQILQAE